MKISQAYSVLLTFVFLASTAFSSTYFLGISGAGGGNGVTPDASVLYRLDPATGAIIRTIGATGVSGITAIAYNPATKKFLGYKSDNNATPAIFDLYSLSLVTGAATLIGSPGPGIGSGIPDMTIQPGTNTLFGWLEGSDDVAIINQSTGTLTVVGDSGLTTEHTGLAFTPSGSLYVKSEESLMQINPATGATIGVAIPITSGGALTLDNMLAFDPSGTMYVADRGAPGTTATAIYAGSATTGVVAQVGTAQARLSALTFLSVKDPAISIKGKKTLKISSSTKKVIVRGTITAGLPIASATYKAPKSKAKSINVAANGTFKLKLKVPTGRKTTKIKFMATDAFQAAAPVTVLKIVRRS